VVEEPGMCGSSLHGNREIPRPASRLRSESVREPEEVLLVDRVHDSDSRPLDDLVLKGGNREWALPTVRFGYVDAPGRQGPICSFMKAVSVGPGYWDQGLPRRLATLPHPLRVRHSP